MAGISRRDMLSVSALGAAALALPFERTVRAKTASKISSKKIPAPYTLPFTTSPVLDGRGGGTLTITQRMANAQILPGVPTAT
jgi:spore coat protein A, manganese oxidase